MNHFYTIFTFLLLTLVRVTAQDQPAWDNTSAEGWPAFCQKVTIRSSLDSTWQPAYVSWAGAEEPRPLVVSLHTWSGDYSQPDTLAWMCHERGYHYIHPDFRGPNNKPVACGSKFVIQDIEDAISYAVAQTNVDPREIHLIGTSGGGYAVLLAYMNTEFPVKTFSAWAPISDLERWYDESKARGNKYAGDILHCIGSVSKNPMQTDSLNTEEAGRRSPIHMQTPVRLRKDSRLFLFDGIHDGYTGSVPVSHSLEFYNKVVRDFAAAYHLDTAQKGALVSPEDMMQMLETRNFVAGYKRSLGGRTVHYERRFADLVRVLIFEGGHEMLPGVALDQVESRNILVIGDSNGAVRDGWVEQIRTIRFMDHILNTSVSGNTIGFDNLGSAGLNTLRNIRKYLELAEDSLGTVDDILIMLGTNDCKKVFRDSLEQVPENLEALLNEIKGSGLFQKDHPRIFVVSPPPTGRDEDMLEKYQGSSDRVAWLQPRFREIAGSLDCRFVDCYTPLEPVWDRYSIDGIHLKTDGQKMIAALISEEMDRP